MVIIPTSECVEISSWVQLFWKDKKTNGVDDHMMINLRIEQTL